jgi:hypothetical protein
MATPSKETRDVLAGAGGATGATGFAVASAASAGGFFAGCFEAGRFKPGEGSVGELWVEVRTNGTTFGCVVLVFVLFATPLINSAASFRDNVLTVCQVRASPSIPALPCASQP